MRNRKILQPIRNWKLRKKLIVSFVALVMLPVLILYICVQKNLTKGMTVGGLKG